MSVGGHCKAFRNVDADARIWCASYAKDCHWNACNLAPVSSLSSARAFRVLFYILK